MTCTAVTCTMPLPGAHVELYATIFVSLGQVIFDKLHETAFQGCGLARTILGPEENIRSLTRDDLVSFIKTHYTGPRVVISGAGAIDHDQVRTLWRVWCRVVVGVGRCCSCTEHITWMPLYVPACCCRW